MRRIACCLLAAISCLGASRSEAGIRPQYGGTLRAATQATMSSLNPADVPQNELETVARGRILPLVFETLVELDAAGLAHPRLAVAWLSDLSFRRWQFYLRPGARFSDGGSLSAAVVVQSLALSLGSVHAEWTARVEGESVVLESETGQPDLLAELALLRNAIARRSPNGEWLGTGPFRITNWQEGKLLELAVNDGAWSGRPYVDSVRIELGKTLRDQMVELELGKVDLIETGADQNAKASGEGRAYGSLPVELLALVTAPGAKAQDVSVREALSTAIDRESMRSALLRGGSEVAGSVLPQWMSGYAFLFPVQVDVGHARVLLGSGGSGEGRTSVPARALMLSYDSGDALARLIAERVALNAREVGLQIQTVASSVNSKGADLRLLRVLLASSNSGMALQEIGNAVGTDARSGPGAEDVYLTEKKLMEGASLIPLFHLPLASLAGERVRNWPSDKMGGWPLAEVSLDAGAETRSGDPSRP